MKKQLNILGPKLRAIRRSAHPSISQEDLAGRLAALGIPMDRSAIVRIENQTRKLSDFELFGFLRALRVDAAGFFVDLFHKSNDPGPLLNYNPGTDREDLRVAENGSLESD